MALPPPGLPEGVTLALPLGARDAVAPLPDARALALPHALPAPVALGSEDTEGLPVPSLPLGLALAEALRLMAEGEPVALLQGESVGGAVGVGGEEGAGLGVALREPGASEPVA